MKSNKITERDLKKVVGEVRKYSERLIKGLLLIGERHAIDKEKYLIECKKFVEKTK